MSIIAQYAVGLFVGSAISWLAYRELTRSDECTHHHFGKWRGHERFRIEEDNPYGYNIEERQSRTCNHEGCYETERRWTCINSVGRDELHEFVSNDG